MIHFALLVILIIAVCGGCISMHEAYQLRRAQNEVGEHDADSS